MKKLVGLLVLAACELQPAPKKAPPPVVTEPAPKAVDTPPPRPAEPTPGSAAGAGSGSAAKLEITAPCMDVAKKVAQVFIDSATDPGQKSIYEQERANMTRKTGEACTTQGWSEEARTCYLATKTPAEIKACELKHPAPQAQPARPAMQPGVPAKP